MAETDDEQFVRINNLILDTDYYKKATASKAK